MFNGSRRTNVAAVILEAFMVWLNVVLIRVAVTTVLAGFRRTNVLVVIVDAVIASLNVTFTAADWLMPVAALAGSVDVTVGRVESLMVVNDHAEFDARALPAVSLTPLDPP